MCVLSLFSPGPVDRGVRKESRDAVPDNWHRVGAPGGAGPLARARTPRDPHPLEAYGSRNLGVRPAFARPVGESRKLPGASRRSNPLFKRDGKRDTAGRPGRPNSKPGFAESWPG